MSGHCKYHPSENGCWCCDSCNVTFCHRCVPIIDGRHPSCVLCRRDLRRLSISHNIEPFWRKLNFFFLYPVQGPLLYYIILLSLLTLLIDASFRGFIISIVLLSLITKCFFGLVLRLAEGNMKIPSFSESVAMGQGYSFIKLYLMFIVVSVFLSTTLNVLPLPIWLVMYLFAIYSIPASLMVYAIESSALSAFDPPKLYFTMKAIGKPYLILFGFMLLINLSSYSLVGIVIGENSGLMVLPIFALISLYFSVILAVMIGYAVYQFHHELGLHIAHEQLQENLEKTQSTVNVDPILAEAEIFIKEGRYAEARGTLERGLHEKATYIPYLDKLHQLNKVMGDGETTMAHAMRYIKILVEGNNAAKTIQIYRDLLGIDKSVGFSDPDICYQLAQAFFQAGQGELVIKVCRNMHKKFPHYPQLADAYFLVAKAYSEYKHDDKKARDILLFIQKNYPQSRVANDVSEYLVHVETLLNKT